jgi:hypothetical protein
VIERKNESEMVKTGRSDLYFGKRQGNKRTGMERQDKGEDLKARQNNDLKPSPPWKRVLRNLSASSWSKRIIHPKIIHS